jgi:hypothetical protein
MLRTTGEGFLACKRERERENKEDSSIVGKLFDAEAKIQQWKQRSVPLC